MSFYESKNILVTGGTGMIGKPLCKMLVEEGAKVQTVSLDIPREKIKGTTHEKVDLRSIENCMKACKDKDIVFHLAGVKGSPKMTKEKPASFMVPTLQFSINMMEAARIEGVKNYLFTSSVGVYEPAEIFNEENVWKTFPSENDKHAGWAKRICELQAEAYEIQYGWKNISIVRPANVYGPHDNFDDNNAMVIPSLIKRALEQESEYLEVWGDGSPIRDFIYSEDVARGMLKAVEEGVREPINLGSGEGVKIKEIAEIIAETTGKQIKWLTDKPMGDKKRIMNTKRAKSYGIEAKISVRDGIKETIKWYKDNKNKQDIRYNSFTDS